MKEDYFRSVLRHWQTIMVGIGSLAVSGISAFFSQKTYIVTFAAFGVSCLFVAGYLTWRDERRKCLAEAFTILVDECERILKFAKGVKNPGPQVVFRPLSPRSFPEQIASWEHKEMLRLCDRMRQHTERVNMVFESRKADYPTACSFAGWPANVNSIDHGELLEMLKEHKKVLKETKSKMLQAT